VDNNIETVKSARNLFVLQSDNNQYIWCGEFVSLFSDLQLNRDKNLIFAKTTTLMMYIMQDLWNVYTLIERLEWTQKKACDDDYLNRNWMFFASVDIEHFFIELRSVMNYVAEITYCTSKKRGQLPKQDFETASFEKLQNWVKKSPGNKERLGEELSQVIESAKWFPSIRTIRNTLIHKGGFALVFMEPKDGILFQVIEGFKNLVNDEIIMYNDNVVYFDRFAAIYCSNFLLFLEKFAENIRTNLQIDYSNSNPRSGFPRVLIQWMDSIINLDS